MCIAPNILKLLTKKIEPIFQVLQLPLIKNAMFRKSKMRSFYLHMMRKSNSVNNGKLFLRCNYICKSYDLSLNQYRFEECYKKTL